MTCHRFVTPKKRAPLISFCPLLLHANFEVTYLFLEDNEVKLQSLHTFTPLSREALFALAGVLITKS